MLEEERKGTGLDMDLGSSLENRLETDPFLSDVATGIGLCALPSATDRADVALR